MLPLSRFAPLRTALSEAKGLTVNSAKGCRNPKLRSEAFQHPDIAVGDVAHYGEVAAVRRNAPAGPLMVRKRVIALLAADDGRPWTLDSSCCAELPAGCAAYRQLGQGPTRVGLV
jgi:hypothetical protein